MRADRSPVQDILDLLQAFDTLRPKGTEILKKL
jgi:hypothetical protein